MSLSENRPTRPLTPATFHILLSVAQGPAHGYRIKRVVEERTEGAVQLGAGTLYAGIGRMVREGLIEETEPPEDSEELEPSSRWRFYQITNVGSDVLRAEIARLEADLRAARAVVSGPA
jgi:DNA-binding PadR family transcriptional regulator